MNPLEETEQTKTDNRYLIVVGIVISVFVLGGAAACIFLLTTFVITDSETVATDESMPAINSEATKIAAAEETAVTETQLAETLPGLYAVEGTNPTSGTYEGTLEIAKPGEYYTVEWNIADEVITGTGLLQDNIFSVSWGGRLCVAQYYKVFDDGSLDGVWFWISEPNQLGTEYVEPLADTSENLLVGVHDMTGVNPDGDTYEGTAEISVSGSVYSITWYVDDDVLPATGVRQGDVISVGWGEDSCSIASYIVNPDGTLNGIWTNVGEALLGTETGEKVGR